MAELFATQVLSRHFGRHIGRHFEKNYFLYFGTLLYAYGLNLSQIGS